MPPKKGYIIRDSEEEWKKYINLCAINYPVLARAQWLLLLNCPCPRETYLYIRDTIDEAVINDTIIYLCEEIEMDPTKECYFFSLDNIINRVNEAVVLDRLERGIREYLKGREEKRFKHPDFRLEWSHVFLSYASELHLIDG